MFTTEDRESTKAKKAAGFEACLRQARPALPVRINENEVVPDYGNAQDQGVDAIEDASVAGQESTRILYASGAFTGGFKEVSHLSRDVAQRGHSEQVRKRNREPIVKGVRDQERAAKPSDRSFPRFLRGNMRGEGVFAEGASREVSDGIRRPRDDEGEEQEAGTLRREAVKTQREGQRKSDEQQAAARNSRGWKRFDEGTASKEDERGQAEGEEKKSPRERRRSTRYMLTDAKSSRRVTIIYHFAELEKKEKKRGEAGPEAVGPVADGVAEIEKFPKGKDREYSYGNGNRPCGREQDETDDHWHKCEGRQNARQGHRNQGSFGLKK